MLSNRRDRERTMQKELEEMMQEAIIQILLYQSEIDTNYNVYRIRESPFWKT